MLIPDHETSVDFLNNEAIATTVIELLRANRQRALTVGVHGDWGAGKSSVLKMVETELLKDKSVSCLWFNGWTFQGFDDAKTVLIESIITELARQRSGTAKVKEIAAGLIKRIDWLKMTKRGGGLLFNVISGGLPSPGQIYDLLGTLRTLGDQAKDLTPEQLKAGLVSAAELLKPAPEHAHVPEQVHEFRKEFCALLEAAKIQQLVVLIDDLDRCLPTTAVETLEAIRLFLFVEKTAFVIGADEAMIEYAVRHHFPDLPVASGPIPYARNYLEKLIQVPFRIPALGGQETKTYVTLLLVEALVGAEHPKFNQLLVKAREILNQPWLSTALRDEDVRAVDPARQQDLASISILAQQIGPALAEGTRGNPRQIKRFLNALMIRQSIAKARGFAERVNQAALAKLMLAERFQQDLYDHIALEAMKDAKGIVADLATKESRSPKGAKGKDKEPEAARASPEFEKMAEREWVQNWLQIPPDLGKTDLRPYVFVARDKRLLLGAAEIGGLEGLIERLSGRELGARMAEPEVKALPPSDAETVFAGLKERFLSHGSFSAEAPGFHGMRLLAKHHVRFQRELVAIVAGLDSNGLGIWLTTGWTEVLTEPQAKQDLQDVLTRWENQDGNAILKRAAGNAATSGRPKSRG